MNNEMKTLRYNKSRLDTDIETLQSLKQCIYLEVNEKEQLHSFEDKLNFSKKLFRLTEMTHKELLEYLLCDTITDTEKTIVNDLTRSLDSELISNDYNSIQSFIQLQIDYYYIFTMESINE